tara:strand:- start:229 stop:438 length:210 start_codon:yes stop_codon:yes gene_type:complete
MKTIAFIAALTQAVTINRDVGFNINAVTDPAGEFADRKAELATARSDRLQTAWMNRIDNYDPDIDQDIA